ncbi:MAG: ABC transporter ATP-binding protein [Promethearchaeota archaeon]
MTNSIPLLNKKEFNNRPTPLLEIKNLTVDYPTTEGNIRAVDNVSLNLYSGEVLGLVGESGCGKSTLGFSLLRLLRGGVVRSGNIFFEGTDLLSLSKSKIRKLRGSDISMVFQASQNALNPLQKISKHFIDTLKVHNLWNPEKWEDVKNLLQRLEIPESRLDDYAFQFSGGMQQRIVIALTLILNPKLIIADEPTTALDVLVQARLLQLLKDIIKEFKLTVIYITHNLGVVAEITQRVAIMYAGQILEVGDTFTIFEDAAHPYTQALISAIPNVKDEEKRKMSFIPGHPPDLRNPTIGCCFADRCSFAIGICKTTLPHPLSLSSKNGHMVKCLMYDDNFSSKFK